MKTSKLTIVTCCAVLITFLIMVFQQKLHPGVVMFAFGSGIAACLLIDLLHEVMRPAAARKSVSAIDCLQFFPNIRFPNDDKERGIVAMIGMDYEYEAFFSKRSFVNETVLFAAVKAVDGTIVAVTRPGRHHHCLHFMMSGEYDFAPEDTVHQGFITSAGRYIDREEAARMAYVEKQYKDEYAVYPTKLFSEDLF